MRGRPLKKTAACALALFETRKYRIHDSSKPGTIIEMKKHRLFVDKAIARRHHRACIANNPDIPASDERNWAAIGSRIRKEWPGTLVFDALGARQLFSCLTQWLGSA
jgi:hypothetical protein